MAARGTEEKEIVKSKILEMFEGAAVVDKDIRIPVGEVEIKVSLTCAKDCVLGTITPVSTIIHREGENPFGIAHIPGPSTREVEPPSEEELAAVNKLKDALGL